MVQVISSLAKSPADRLLKRRPNDQSKGVNPSPNAASETLC